MTRKAIKINPKFVEAYNNLGLILRELGELKEAEKYQREAIKIKPDLAESYSKFGIFLLTRFMIF